MFAELCFGPAFLPPAWPTDLLLALVVTFNSKAPVVACLNHVSSPPLLRCRSQPNGACRLEPGLAKPKVTKTVTPLTNTELPQVHVYQSPYIWPEKTVLIQVRPRLLFYRNTHSFETHGARLASTAEQQPSQTS